MEKPDAEDIEFQSWIQFTGERILSIEQENHGYDPPMKNGVPLWVLPALAFSSTDFRFGGFKSYKVLASELGKIAGTVNYTNER